MHQDDPKLLLEVSEALMEKRDTFKPSGLAAIKDMLKKHSDSLPAHVAHGARQVDLDTSNLEEQAFKLDVDTIKNDVARYEVWKTKCNDRKTAMYYVELEWKQASRQVGQVFASNWVHKHMCFTTVDDGLEGCVSNLDMFIERLKKETFIVKGEVASVGFINWASLSTVPTKATALHMNLARITVSKNGNHVVLLQMSMFSYKSNTLWLAEVNALKTMGNTSMIFTRNN